MSILFTSSEHQSVCSLLQRKAQSHSLCAVRYLALGVSTIRLLCFHKEVLPILEHQLSYVLRDSADHFDHTIVVWKQDDMTVLWKDVARCVSRKTGMQIRSLQMLPQFQCPIELDDGKTGQVSILDREMLEYYHCDENTVFSSYKSFEPEAFVKFGHAFVRIINRLIQSDTVNLTHGAAFGYHGNGILLCGRGKRGKSTLTVESMLQGFEYVSDDYQIVEKTDSALLAYPIYSMITLSYRMYNEMFERFQGKFLCNNFSQDKYLFHISAYHSQFRSAYPVRFCLFPQIVADEHPSIVPCTAQEKGRAIVQLIHSTVSQMGQSEDTQTIQKLFFMLRNMPFLKMNLSRHISENSAYLKAFLSQEPFPSFPAIETEPQMLDITFGLAVILDTATYRLTTLNKFATNLFMLVLSGVSPAVIKTELEPLRQNNPMILIEFERLLCLIEDRHYRCFSMDCYPNASFLPEYAARSAYKLSALEYREDTVQELLSSTI